MATETKSKINASIKRAIRKKVDQAGRGQLYDYDRIAARHTAIRELASEHKVSVAEVEEVLRGRDEPEPDPGIAAVDTSPPVLDEDALKPLDKTSADAHQAAPTLGEVEKENKQVAREQEKEARRQEREAKNAPAKKAPAKKAAGGRSSSSSSRR